MKKAREVLISSCRTLNKTPISPTHFHETMSHSDTSNSNRYSFSPTLHWNPQLHQYFLNAYAPDHFSRISTALTRPSRYSCIRVNTLRSTADAVIDKLRSLVPNESPQSGDDVANPLKECLDADAAGPFSKCRIPGLEYVVFAWGSGPQRIDYGNVPPKEVIVSRKCAEAVLRGAQVYVPGVMACSAHVEKGDIVAVSVAVEKQGADGGWGIGMTRGTVLQGSDTDPYYFERNGLYIGQGTAMMSRAGMFRVSEGVGVDMKNRVYELHSFHNVLEGEIFLQNLPSIIAAHALDPQKGERILDMCAAPGGKTTAIAILMKDEGEIIATDRSHNKVLNIQKLAAEMGLSCIKTFKLDALKSVCRRDDIDTSFCSNAKNDATNQVFDSPNLQVERVSPLVTEGEGEKTNGGAYVSKAEIRKNMRRARNGPGRNQCVGGRVDRSKGFSPDSFDRVLLDAPCSALGLRPRLFAGEETVESLRSHAKYQRRMFDQAVQLVRPGGVIVYSTVEDLCIQGLETCYLLDFIPPKEFLLDLSRKSKCKVIGFDHRKSVLRHIPSANDCPENIVINVNHEKSSSSSVYEYFAGKLEEVNISSGAAPCLVDSKDKGRVELILKYIEDADLRRWSLPGIKAFNLGLSEWRSRFNCISNPYMFKQLLELSAEDLIAKGNSYVSSRQNSASKLLEKVFRVRLGRGFYGECLGVRADGNSNLSDEIGKLLSVKSAATGLRPIGAVIFMQRNNLKMCLRSIDSATDTSEVAKAYGGGGSPSSSSFIIRMDEYNQWISGNSS